MIVTMNIPDTVNRKLEAEKRKTGLSKSYLIRTILEAHFTGGKSQKKED